jgi:hypothetical protein
MQDRPTAIELLEAAAEFVEREIVPITEGARQFQSRVVANVMRIVAREIEMGEQLLREEVDALAALLGESPPNPRLTDDVRNAALNLNQRLSEKIRQGEADSGSMREQVFRVTRRIVEDKLRIANPRYLERDLQLRAGSTRPR